MSRSKFGWSYPPGCSGPPEEKERPALQCSNKQCRGFLGGEPIRTEPWEDSMQCDGSDSEGMCQGPAGKHEPHKVVWDCGVGPVYKCKKCGKENLIRG
jgi:hypothetical protein